MKLKLAKCKFRRNKIHFLGHAINYKGIWPLMEKNNEISKIKAPSNAIEVCTLLGLLNYYCWFIPAFADLMHPIQKLLKKNMKFEWAAKCDKVFRIAKETLTDNPILHHPDPNIPLNHWNRCKQNSLCRHTTSTTHRGWNNTGSPSDIHFLQLYQNATRMEHHQTLCNLHINAQTALHDKRVQSDN